MIGGGAVIIQVLAEQLAVGGGPGQIAASEHDILDGIALPLAQADQHGHPR
ncbi:hypothetical protein [Amycolatopsis taiwanensis]|uniref:hypothetical protein n=1 Tax=Amycolatopsis taiwanensis TaxID=342230 RepID=UPI0012EB8F8B|nr:hypothetical protein [Amycolatopsis taiwanensis]